MSAFDRLVALKQRGSLIESALCVYFHPIPLSFFFRFKKKRRNFKILLILLYNPIVQSSSTLQRYI